MVLGIISPSWCSSLEIGFRTYPNFTSLRLVLYAVIENFGYRQLNVWWRFWAIIDKIREGPSGSKTKERIRAGGRDAGDWGAEALIRRRRPARKRSAMAVVVLFSARDSSRCLCRLRGLEPLEQIRADSTAALRQCVKIADKLLAENQGRGRDGGLRIWHALERL